MKVRRGGSDGAERAGGGNKAKHHAEPHATGVDHEFLGPFAPPGDDAASYPCRRPLTECPPQGDRADNGDTPSGGTGNRRNANEGEKRYAERHDDVSDGAEERAARGNQDQAAEGREAKSNCNTGQAALSRDASTQVDDSTGNDASAPRSRVGG